MWIRDADSRLPICLILRETPPVAPQTQAEAFRILSPLGARDTPLNRDVAVKAVPGDFSWLVLLLALLASMLAAHAAAPLAPTDELRSFQFADPNLTAELVATEPDVISPVAMTWDADGRLFVAEMRDYPNAATGGSIRMLEDRNHDGRYETATMFADKLSFPNSVLPWNGGLLVTTAPDLLFLKDTDGDGHADERHVLFTGFAMGNQQLRANGLLWGLDGWVYGANGRSDGSVRAVEVLHGSTWVRTGDQLAKTNSIRGRDFRFRPGTGEFETLAGRSQFGLTRDDWGNRFLSWNTIPIRHEVFADRYLARNPNLAVTDVLADLMPVGDAGEVFPLTPAPLVFNNESGSHFNALAGLHIYRGDVLGSAYHGNAFMGETLRNLVHRRVLAPQGASFIAQRTEERTEFLRSSDPWFHPVNFATGPDGALYLIDFYRQFVEHPDYVPREMRDKMTWRTGSEHGRIWRIVRKDARPKPVGSRLGLAQASWRELLRQLDSPNAWRRDTAQRLIVERQSKEILPALRSLARMAKPPQTRVQALSTLAGLSGLDEKTLLRALEDPDAHVRAHAAQLSELLLPMAVTTLRSPDHSSLVDSLLHLTADPNPDVRLHVALTLGLVKEDTLRERALQQLIKGTDDPWIRLAAISSSHSLTKEEIKGFLPEPRKSLRQPPSPPSPNPDRQRVIENYAPALKLAGDPGRGAATFAKLCLACHYLQGHGQRVGPDLSGINSRPADVLLVDLLDPSRQITPDHVTYEALKSNGETVSGLLASETETRVILRHAGAPDETIPRSELKSLRATAKSLMPDGLEAGLSNQDMADLLEFLRKADGSLIPR
ncbi:MAG: c-type cytochrome [Pedosphaera sp.]|nr:c-type cytochrome [Pedosphaera sp.]